MTAHAHHDFCIESCLFLFIPRVVLCGRALRRSLSSTVACVDPSSPVPALYSTAHPPLECFWKAATSVLTARSCLFT